MSAVTWKQQAAKAREVVQMHMKWGYIPLEVCLWDTHFDVKKLMGEINYEPEGEELILRMFDENLKKAKDTECYCYTTPIRFSLEDGTLKMYSELDRKMVEIK